MELLVESLDGARWSLQLVSPAVVIAGFTGRDPVIMREHIQELARIGVPEPATVPAFYTVPDWTLVQPGAAIQVATGRASGEAEPVLVSMPDGAKYLTVGSDHTDRDLERESIDLAKRTQPKVIGGSAWPFAEVEDRWDDLFLRSWVGADAEPYQEGRLGSILPPLDLLERIHAEVAPRRDQPLIAFLGTVPLHGGGFRFERSFRAAIDDVSDQRRLDCGYEVEPIDRSAVEEAR